MKKLDFNQNWVVRKEGSETVRPVNLPDDAMLREERKSNAKSGSGGAFFEGGKYYYSKDWYIGDDLTDKKLILEFEGVYQNAQVILNGAVAGEHPYGYTGFFVDATDMVHPGHNELTVIADNSQIPNTRWYSGSGIYRPVSLHVAGKDYIAPEGLQVDCLDENRVHIVTQGIYSPDCQMKIEIRDSFGKVVAKGIGFDLVVTIPNVVCWTAEQPYLYSCKATLMNGEAELDSSESRFGMRTLSWGKNGLLINGDSVLLRGACIHHDNGILGACSFQSAANRQVRILKESGFNAIRSAHNPISKAMLDACDEQGMYVVDEAFDMWLIHKNPYDYAGETFRKWWKKDLSAMISRDRNHPSVIMYSIGNEISELGREDGQQIAREMTSLCHEMDAARPVTAGVNLALAQMAAISKKSKPFAVEDEKIKDDTKSAPTSEFFNKLMNYLGNRMDKASSTGGANKIAAVMREILDIPGYNYATSRYEQDALEAPEQATVGSETMTYNLYRNWQLVKLHPSLIGDFMWTGWDHLGESGIGTIIYMDRKTKNNIDPGLVITSGAGVIDICGNPRPETGWNRIIWGLETQPVIGVSPYTHARHFKSKRMWRKTDTIASWSWKGCEGACADVVVYAKAPFVELLCNGKTLGKQKTKNMMASFKNIPYNPGKLEAVSLDENSNEIHRSALTSAQGKTNIRLSPEVKTLHPNGQDLCYVEIELVGENGIVQSAADCTLTICVSGPGSLQGFGSARPNMAENFISSTHTTYYGRALAVIRAGMDMGMVTVTVSGDNLETQTIQVSVE